MLLNLHSKVAICLVEVLLLFHVLAFYFHNLLLAVDFFIELILKYNN